MSIAQKRTAASLLEKLGDSLPPNTLTVDQYKDVIEPVTSSLCANKSTMPTFDYRHRVTGKHFYTMTKDGYINLTDKQLILAAVGIDNPSLIIENLRYIGVGGVMGVCGGGEYSFSPNEIFQGVITLQYGINNGLCVRKAEISIELADFYRVPISSSRFSYTLEEDHSITCMHHQLLFCMDQRVDDSVFIESLSVSNDGVVIDNGDSSFSIALYGDFVSKLELTLTISSSVDNAVKETQLAVSLVGELMLVDENTEYLAVNKLAKDDACGKYDHYTYSLDTDGVLLLSQQLIKKIIPCELSHDDLVVELEYEGHDGILIDNIDGSWSFWSDPGFEGMLSIGMTTARSIVFDVLLEIKSRPKPTVIEKIKTRSDNTALVH